jgi:hypothetical protein
MSASLNTSIEPQFRTVDGLNVRFAESEPRDEHALLLSPWPESLTCSESAAQTRGCGRVGFQFMASPLRRVVRDFRRGAPSLTWVHGRGSSGDKMIDGV